MTVERHPDLALSSSRRSRWASRLIAHPVRVLLLWAVAVGACLPFALTLPDVLTEQGASKIVPGSEGARVADVVTRWFPQHSERETVAVVTAPDVADPAVRRYLIGVDELLRKRVASGEALQVDSAVSVLREAVLEASRRTIAAAGLQAQGLSEAERQARLSAATAAAPAPLRELVTAQANGADERRVRELADDVVATSDWRRFPVPLDLSPVVAGDWKTTLVTLGFTTTGDDPDFDALRRDLAGLLTSDGLAGRAEVAVTGELALIKDTYDRAEADNALMEQVAYVIIGIVLLLFFRAILPMLLTLTVIGLAMNVSQAWLHLVGRQVTLTQFTVTIMTFVMLGAGVDYSMLLSSRYRQERLRGLEVREAVVAATVHAGESIMLAGIAVVLAFGATLLAPVDWIPPLGYGGLAGVPIVLLAALTITPCLLILLGDRFFLWGWKPMSDLESTSWVAARLRAAASVSRRAPRAVVVAFLVVTVPAIGLVTTQSLSSDPLAMSPDTDARRGYERISAVWGEGLLQPTVVVGRLAAPPAQGQELPGTTLAALADVGSRLAAVEGVDDVRGLSRPAGKEVPPEEVAALPPQVRRDYLADDGKLRWVVALHGNPLSAQGRATVDRVEAALRTLPAGVVSDLRVGGATVVDREYDAALISSFWQMVLLVSIGIFVLLLFALRSVVVPIRLIVTIMMSNVWAVAVTFLVFGVWRDDAVINDLPVFLVILMMGLGMDYEIFLMTRVRDLMRAGVDDADAVTRAVVDTGRVITSAGIVMAGSLGTMMLSSTLMLQQYGLGLATAVLLDATLMRMLFVPASLLLLRRWNWWWPGGHQAKAAADGAA